MAGLLRHRQTKGAATDRLGLRDAESYFLLYPLFGTPPPCRRTPKSPPCVTLISGALTRQEQPHNAACADESKKVPDSLIRKSLLQRA